MGGQEPPIQPGGDEIFWMAGSGPATVRVRIEAGTFPIGNIYEPNRPKA